MTNTALEAIAILPSGKNGLRTHLFKAALQMTFPLRTISRDNLLTYCLYFGHVISNKLVPRDNDALLAKGLLPSQI